MSFMVTFVAVFLLRIKLKGSGRYEKLAVNMSENRGGNLFQWSFSLTEHPIGRRDGKCNILEMSPKSVSRVDYRTENVWPTNLDKLQANEIFIDAIKTGQTSVLRCEITVHIWLTKDGSKRTSHVIVFAANNIKA